MRYKQESIITLRDYCLYLCYSVRTRNKNWLLTLETGRASALSLTLASLTAVVFGFNLYRSAYNMGWGRVARYY